jgi:hypothetical protein
MITSKPTQSASIPYLLVVGGARGVDLHGDTPLQLRGCNVAAYDSLSTLRHDAVQGVCRDPDNNPYTLDLLAISIWPDQETSHHLHASEAARLAAHNRSARIDPGMKMLSENQNIILNGTWSKLPSWGRARSHAKS